MNNEIEAGTNVEGNPADDVVTWREFLNAGYTSSLALVCLAVWLHAADSLIVATMLPDIVREIGGMGLVGWSVTLYELGSITAGACGALLTMKYGLQKPMAVAALVFAVGCFVSALAEAMSILLVGRLLQGLGGGGLVALCFIAVSSIFPKRYVARAIAAVSTLWGMSAFLGPLIGGFFVEFFNWRIGFAFFGAQAVLLAMWIASQKDISTANANGEAGARVPLGRLLVLSLGVLSIAYAGVTDGLATTFVFIAVGLLLGGVFLLLDGRSENSRLLPKNPLNVRNPAGAGLMMVFSLAIATIALTAFGPLLVTAIHGVSPLAAGFLVACSTIGWSITAVVFSGSPERNDGRMISIGMVIISCSVIGLAVSIPTGPLAVIGFFAALEGAGFGLAWTFIMRRTTSLSDPAERERISGSIPTIHRLGYAVGAAYIGIIANSIGFGEMSSADEARSIARTMFLSCVPFLIVGLVAMLRLISDPEDQLDHVRTDT